MMPTRQHEITHLMRRDVMPARFVERKRRSLRLDDVPILCEHIEGLWGRYGIEARRM